MCRAYKIAQIPRRGGKYLNSNHFIKGVMRPYNMKISQTALTLFNGTRAINFKKVELR